MDCASVLLVSVVFFGCEKENMTPIKDVSKTYMTFDTWEDFMNTLKQLEEETFLKEWEASIDFTTLHSYKKIMDEDFVKVKSKEDFENFMKKYEGDCVFKNQTIYSNYKLGQLEYLLNTEGIVEIDGMIQQFLPDDRIITIADGDISKLAVAKEMTESDEKNHIFITHINRNFSEEKTYLESECNDNNGEWKLESQMIFTNWATPIYGSGGVFTGVFNIGWALSVESASYNKGFFGNWYKKKSNLSANGNYTVVVVGISTINRMISESVNNTKTLFHRNSGSLGTLDTYNPNAVHPSLRIPSYDIDFFLKTGITTQANCSVFEL